MDTFSIPVTITNRNITITPALEKHIYKKLQFLEKFNKYIDKIVIVFIDNKAQTTKMKYEVTVYAKQAIIRVEEEGNDLYSVVDLVHDTLKIKIDRYKERITSKQSIDRNEAIEEAPTSEGTEYEVFDYQPKITKRKIYSDNRPLHPMEAIEQMEMIGHPAFLFKNIETGKYSMIYKRRNGTYGLIEPENS